MEIHVLTADWMREAKLPRMQHLALEAGTTAVHFVTDKRMAKMFEVHADLVCAAGVQRAFDERASGEFLQNAVVGAGGAAAFAGEHGHFFAMDRMASDRAFDDAAFLAELAGRNREIDFRDFASGELPRECAVGDIVFGGDETAARFLIQPMHDAGPLFAADAGETFAMVQQRIDECAVRVAGGGVDDVPAGLFKTMRSLSS